MGLQNSLVEFSFPEIRKLVRQIVKLKLLKLHLAIAFTKVFINPHFIRRGDIRTYHDLLVEDAELLDTVHSRNIWASCGRKRKLLKILNVKSIFNTVRNSRATLFFRASAGCLKIMNGEKIFNTVYIHLGAIRAIWASVVLIWTKVTIGFVTLIWTKPSFTVKIEQSDVGSSTAWYKNSVTISLFVFEFALGRGAGC